MWGLSSFLMCPEWPQSYIYPVLPLSEANFPGVSNSKEEKEPKWVPMLYKNSDFKVNFMGIMFNNHLINGSNSQTVAFVDSGTTFTYMNN